MKVIFIAVISLVFLVGCGRPLHEVYGTDDLKVYSTSIVDDSNYGQYEYFITDGTPGGWVLRTDKKYQIGDRLSIEVISAITP